MDIFSHGLWTGAVYKIINKKTSKPLSMRLACFWGVFPDLFAFAIPFIWMAFNLIFGKMSFSDFPRPEEHEPPIIQTSWTFRLAPYLYNFSHSIFIFLVIFFLIYLIFKRPVWELGGWLIHIISDIPTHSYRFYPTPFLWPLSDWKFNGFSWGTLWFLIPNYIVIIIVYILLRKKKY